MSSAAATMSNCSPYTMPAVTAAGPSCTTSSIQRKVVCRYGSGCTHIMDPAHKEKFWHPSAPKLNNDQLKGQFICNECGYSTTSLHDLQLHLKRKTAWSNQSLVGCRINCLVDYKEWHEGHVTQFHKSGKHFVEFRVVGEKRWLVMKKIAFYIVERPQHNYLQYSTSDAGQLSPSSDGAAVESTADSGNRGTAGASAEDNNWSSHVSSPKRDNDCSLDGTSNNYGSSSNSEFKENSSEVDNLAPIENCWVFCEDISLEYAFAQSVLFKIYGNSIQETGHLTKGHVCLTESDRLNAQYVKGSLLYGELLPRGANKAFNSRRLDARKASVLFDLGMGTGKIVVQAFLQFKNLRYIFGIELSAGRYKIAEEAVLRMVRLLGADNYNVQINPGHFIIVTEAVRKDIMTSEFEADEKSEILEGDAYEYEERVLHLQCGNMFDIKNIEIADVVMMETDIPMDVFPSLQQLLGDCKDGCRVLSYLDLRRVWEVCVNAGQVPFKQLEVNRHLSDRYPTSWSVQRGHHFYLWIKVSLVEQGNVGGGITSGGGWGLGFGGLVASSSVQQNRASVACSATASSQSASGQKSSSTKAQNLSASHRSANGTAHTPEVGIVNGGDVNAIVVAHQLNARNKSRSSVQQDDAKSEQQVSRCVPIRRFGFLFRNGSSSDQSRKNNNVIAGKASVSAEGNNALSMSNGMIGTSSRGSRKSRRSRSGNGDADGIPSNERVVIPVNADGTRTAHQLQQGYGVSTSNAATGELEKDTSKQQLDPTASNYNDLDINDGAYVLYPRGSVACDTSCNNPVATNRSDRGIPHRDSNVSDASGSSNLAYPHLSRSAHSASSIIHVGNDGETITGSAEGNMNTATPANSKSTVSKSNPTAASQTMPSSDYLYMSDVRARLRASSPVIGYGTTQSSADRKLIQPTISPEIQDDSPQLHLEKHLNGVGTSTSIESMHGVLHRTATEQQQQQQRELHHQHTEPISRDGVMPRNNQTNGAVTEADRCNVVDYGDTANISAQADAPTSPRTIESIVHKTGVEEAGLSSMMLSDFCSAASKCGEESIESNAIKAMVKMPSVENNNAYSRTVHTANKMSLKSIDRSTATHAAAAAAELMNSSTSAAAAAAATCMRREGQGHTNAAAQAIVQERNYQLDVTSRDNSSPHAGRGRLSGSDHEYHRSTTRGGRGNNYGTYDNGSGCTMS